jgi:uncharacterized repeat protein (TIGR01451 family)
MGHRTIWRRRTPKLATPLAVLGLAAMVVPLGFMAQLPITASTPNAAAASDPGLPTTCDPSTIFNVAGSQTNPAPAGSASGTIYELDASTGVNTQIGAFNSGNVPVNGLGITPDLSDAYAVRQNASAAVGQTIYQFAQDGATASFQATIGVTITFVMGAVDPANGIYYYAGYQGSGASLVLAIYGFDPSTGTVLGPVANVSEAGTTFSTGDIAFDSSGNLFIVAGTNLTGAGQTNTAAIQRVDGPLPTAGPPPATFQPTTIATKTAPAAQGFYNGIAFAANGTIYAQYASGGQTSPSVAFLDDLNPITGEPVVGRVQQSNTPAIGILTDLAGCELPGTLTVQKDLPSGRAGAADQFTMSIEADGITTATNTTTGATDGVQDEKAGPIPGVPGTTYTISEELAQGSTATSLNAYDSAWECHDTNTGGTFTDSGTGISFTLDFPTPDTTVLGANVICTFTNTPVAPSLTLSKALGGRGRVNVGTDQFTMQIIQNSTSDIVGTTTTTGSGVVVTDGSTTVSPASAGPYTLTEVAAGTTIQTNYTPVIQCRDVNGVQPETALPNGPFNPAAPPSVTPAPGADIDCVITNTPFGEPVLQLNKALGSDRVRDTDQFTVAVLVGSQTGPSLGVEGNVNPTTSGVGAVVEPDTGTTGFLPVTVSTPNTYYLTETASGSTILSSYTSTVTCVDLEGRQTTGLPENVPLSAHPSVTPTNLGAVISCAITNTAIQPTLQLSKALPGGRANAGDQFTMQILADDRTTVETDATTAGTGTTVTGGVASLTPATAGDTYFLNEVPAAGTTTDLAQYTATITCTDAHDVATGLPSDQPFEGPFQIMPPLGAVISCTITNVPIPPFLELDKALGSVRSTPTDQFTMQIESPPGTVVGTTSDATTTGSGDTVDAGTGTTQLSPATFGSTYTLAEVGGGTPPANLAAYAATITCLDTQGLQPDLPVGAPFTGSTTITPAAGTSISCTVTNTAKPVVNVSVTKTSSPNPYTQGHLLTYTIVVRNGGPTTAAPATVDDPLPIQLAGAGFTWTCMATTGSTCGAATGVAPLHDTPTIVAGGSVTYTLTGTVPAATAAVLTNVVTVTPPPGVFDPGCDPDCTASNVDPAAPAVLVSAVPIARTGADIVRSVLLAAALLCAGIVLLLGQAGVRRRARHVR